MGFELAQLLGELCFHVAILGEDVGDGVTDGFSDLLDSLKAQTLDRDGTQHLRLDLLDAEPRHGALLVLASGANEVFVGATVAGVLAVDESALAAGVRALSAAQEPLEVVEVCDVAVASAVALVEHLLHLEEGLFGDQRLMASNEQFAFVAHDARVVRVAQDQGESAAADGLCRTRGRRTRGESTLVQHARHLGDGVSPGGVLLERPDDQRCAFVVDVDGVDEAAVEVLADVEVAELGASDGAALLDLVRHLDLDVLAVHADLDFVHDVGDGLHGVGHVAVTELFLRGDEAHALLQELPFRDRGIGEVSEYSGSHVDDDVFHSGMLVDVTQQLLELGSLCDRLCGLAGLHELLRDSGAKFAHLAHRLDTLGRDTVAVFIEVGCGVQLAWRRDAQVDDGLGNADVPVLGRSSRRRTQQVFKSVE